MYNYLKNSGSLYREYIGSDFYDKYWNEVLNEISNSLQNGSIDNHLTDEEIDNWLKTSGSFFRRMSDYGDSSSR